MKQIATTFAVAGFAMMAMMAAANGDHSHKSKKAKPASDLALAQPNPACAPMIGTWTLRNGDQPRRDIRMVFRPNGTFAFVGPNWQSTGTFKMGDHQLALEWSTVDGSKVAPGTIHKAYPMADDDSSFTIDKYTYYKLAK